MTYQLLCHLLNQLPKRWIAVVRFLKKEKQLLDQSSQSNIYPICGRCHIHASATSIVSFHNIQVCSINVLKHTRKTILTTESSILYPPENKLFPLFNLLILTKILSLLPIISAAKLELLGD